MPSVPEYHGTKVFIRENGKRFATPIFAVLLVVASTDVLFAIDSIPAIFAVTDEAFIVLAANAFALMGLRAGVLRDRRGPRPLPVPQLRPGGRARPGRG